MSFADEYMALRAKRLAEIKETGKVQETPVEHTAPAGGGAVSDFGARYMALRQKRIADGYKTLTAPPDLGGRGPKAPFAIDSDPFGRKPVVEEIHLVKNQLAADKKMGELTEYDRSLESYQSRVEAALARGDWQGAGELLRQMAQENLTPEEWTEAAKYIDRVTSNRNLYGYAESAGAARDSQASEEARMAKNYILDLADRGNWEELYTLMHSPEGAKYKRLLKEGYGIDADSPQSREQNYMGLVSQLEYGDEYGFNTLSKSGESYKTLLGTTAFTQRAAEEVQRASKHEGSAAQIDSFTRAQTAYYVLDQLYDELGFGTDSVVTADNTRTRYLLKFLEEECGVDLTGLNASNGAEMIRKAQEEQGGKADLMNRTLKGQGYDTEVVRQYMENTVQQGLAEEGEKAFKDFWANASVWEKIGMNILSVPHKVFVSPLAAASQLGAMGGRGSDTDDPNSYVPIIARTDGATRVRTATDEDIDSGFWSFVYNAGMSAADSAANALVFGKGATFFMSLAGAGDTANEILARGGSREQALRGGIAAGAIEAMTEHFSIDQLLKGADSVHGLKSLMKSVGQQALTEGSEEMSSEILNIIVDSANMGNLSRNSQAVAEYMDEGLSYNDARYRVLLDNVKQVAESGAMGAVSGGMSAFAFGAPSAVRGTVARQRQKKYQPLLDNSTETEYALPDWEQYEQEHEGERFQYDPTSEKVDQLEDMRGWREDTYEQAQSYTDRELTHAIEEKRAIRDDASQDNKSRAIAQHHLDALEYTQMQRQNNNAALNEQRVEGVKYSGAEGLNDSGQRSAGVGAQEQTGGMAEGTGRSIPRGQGKTEKAIVEDIRGNAAAQSARGIGIIGGSESAELRVIPAERIDESESWSRIRDEVEAKGQKLALVVGKMETVDPVTKKVYTHEGIRQVNADGTVTYYIKADKITRNAEQIYKHEDFHDIVDYNPQLLPGLVKALEDQYGKQELMSLIYSYVEAFDGVYGSFEEGMTAKAEHALVMKYAEEIFADAYGEINRGRKNIENAKQALRDQTDRVQRAAQNRKATESKTAPPSQKYSYAGRKARTADHEALRKAQQMLEDGSTMEDIRRETGWHQGFDGKWRFEIDDSQMKYHRNGDARFVEMHPEYREHQDLTMKFIHGTITNQEMERLHELGSTWGNEQVRLRDRVAGGNAKLSDILSHDALYEAYPELADVSIRFGELEDGENGYYDRRSNTIVITDKLQNKPESTLIHEIQHAIQKAEGFSRGSSVEYWVAKLAADRQREVELADKKYREIFDSMPEELKNKVRAYNRANLDYDYDEAIAIENELLESEYGELFSALQDADFERRNLRERYKNADLIEDAITNYHNTAGEIEARDSAVRRNLSAENRRLLAPNYGGHNTVVVDDETEQKYYSRKSPKDVAESEVRALLRQVKNREISGKGYIPVRVSTPGIVCERLFGRDLPLIMSIDKAHQSMSDDNGPAKGKNIRGHQFSEDDMIEIFKRMDSPDYVYDQPSNGRGIEVIKYRSNDDFVAVIIEFSQNVNPAYMSGYTGGAYNVSVTVYPIDDGNIGLFDQIKKNKWEEVFNKEKEGDPAKKFPATRPFAVEQDLPTDRVPHGTEDVKQNFSVDDSELTLEDRVSGDDYLNALDLIEEIKLVGAQVDSYGYVTLYHRTSDVAAKTIYRTGVMTAKEDGLFFSTNASGANNYAYGDSVVELKVPAEMLVLDDIFADEASIRIPLEGRRRMNVSEYLVRKGNAETQKFSVDDEARELDEGYARAMEEDGEPEGTPSDQQIGEQYDQLAKGRKEQNAKDAPLHTLKSRIASAERRIAILQETKKSLQGVGGLTAEVSRSLDSQIEKARETLKIDRTAWQKKWRAHTAEEKKKTKEKKEKEIATQKARTAQKELKQDLLNLFSVREGTRTELGNLIDKLSDKMLAQGHLSHEDRKNLFDALMDNGEKLSNPDEYFRNVRSFMTQGRIYVSEEVRAEFGDDWKAFQNRAWGNRIYLTSDETDVEIDVWTECLKTEFGGQFSGENDLKTQLEMIIELAEEGKPERLTIAEMMQREMNEFGWSVEEQVEELEGKVDKLLEIFAQKADLEIRLRQQSLRQRMKDYDLYRTMQENKRQSAMENQARKNVMSAIQKLNKMRKRASPDQRAAIDEALKGIDVVARSISASGLEDLQELARLYNEQREAQGANFLSSPYVEARLARLGQKQIDDMDIEEVVELGRMVCSITNAIQNSNKLLASARKEDVYATARKAEEEIWNSEGSKDGRLRKLTLNHLDGKRFFGQISGWVNGVVERLGEALSTGQERQMRYQMNAMRIFDKFLSNEENQAFMKTASGKDAKWIKVAVPKGFKTQNRGDLVETSEIEITPMMRISLLLHSKNEDNLRHIMTGGIRIPNKEQYRKGNMGAAYDKGIRVKMDPATVRAIVKGCTEQEKAFARLCESYFNGMAKDYINEVSMVLDGFERAGGEHYYHIKTDPAFLAIQNDAVKRDLSVAATASIVNERVHASNPIVLQDATDALMEHVESISKYYGYAVPIRDLNAVLGQTFHGEENAFNGSVLETLKQKWGGSAEAYIDKLVADLQLPDSSKDYLSDFMVKLRGNYARAVISANLSSLLKQTTSYPVALPYLKMDGLIHGLAFKNMAQDVKTLEKYSAVYWYRNQGNSTAELSDVLKRREFGDALPWLFNATQKMDSWTTRRILAACEYRVQKDMGLMPGTQAEIDAGTDRYWSEVAKLFNDVVLKTQSNSTMMERPQITRANARNISRFLTMFRTDAYQQYNMLVEAAGRLRAAKKDFSNAENADNKKALSNARRFATRTVVGTLIGQIGCALVGVLLKKLRYDDEEFVDEEGQWDWGKVAGYIGGSVVEGYCGFITCGEWLYAAVEASLDKSKKWWDIDVSGLSVIDDVATAGINLVRALTSANLWEGKGAAKDFALALSKMAGIPAENMEKYLYMCLRWVAPEFVTIRENFWDEITKSDLSKESRKTIREAVSVLMDNRAEGLTDHDKDEIARLYMAGGVGAVPAGIPSSISYTNEDGEQIAVDLTSGQQKQFRELWSDIVSEEIGKILETDAYKEADDEGKTELIAKLYSYANALIAHELVPEKEVAKWVLQGETAQETGIPLGEYIAFRVGLSDVTGKDDAGETVTGLKAQRSMELIEAMGWSDQQEESVWLDVVASNSVGAATKALTDAGVPWDVVNNLVVMPGGKTEKLVAIGEAKLSDQVKVKAMSVYAGDLEKKMLSVGLKYGVKPEWYTEVLKNANADSKGGISQSEAREYILGMGLSLQDMAVLFQMVTDAKEGKSNPFYPSYAELFWYDVHEDDPE